MNPDIAHLLTKPAISRLLAMHEVFRRIGFSADDIFIHRRPDGAIFSILVVNSKQFRIIVAPVGFDSEEQMAAEWRTVCEYVSANKPEFVDLLEVWLDDLRLNVIVNTPEMLLAIEAKGIRVPAMNKFRH
jgi:hypothetical protein